VLKDALERYFQKHGKYPAPYGDNNIIDLKDELVGEGFLEKMPQDPKWGGSRVYRYVSSDGESYGLYIHLEQKTDFGPAGGSYLTGVGTDGTGWWGQPPEFPF
jgi:hypothetical protein